MTGLVALAVVGALVGIVVGLMRRPKSSRWLPDRVLPIPDLGLAESDLAELSAVGHRVEQEFGVAPVQVLLHRVGNVVRRSVPLSAIRPGPARGLARMCFADGTTLQVRGRQVGDLGQLAVTAITHKVRVCDYHAEDSRVVLDLEWGRGHASVVAVGIDQAD